MTTVEPQIGGVCVDCNTTVFTALLDGVRVTLDRPPSPSGDVFVRFDLDPIVAVARGPVVDLTDPFDDGTRYLIHDCVWDRCSMCDGPIVHAEWSGWMTLADEPVCDSCAPSTSPSIEVA